MIRIATTLFFWLFACGLLCAQGSGNYSFTHFSTVQGLASNYVNSLVQDEAGFMWIATINGLQRYDGNNFVTFHHRKNKPTSVPDNNLTRLYKDRRGNLWLIAANNKVGTFDTHTFTFTGVPVQYKTEKKTYWHKYFFETPSGDLLLHESADAFYKYDRNKKAFVPDQFITAPQNWVINGVHWDDHLKKYWVTADSGLLLYDPATKRLNYRGRNPDNDPAISKLGNLFPVFGVYTRGQGDLYFSTWPRHSSHPYLYRYLRSSNTLHQHNLITELGLGYHEIMGFLEQKSGRFWVYGNPFVAEWGKGSPAFLPVPQAAQNGQGLRFDRANLLYEDRDRNIWIATDNGLFLFNPDAQLFHNYKVTRYETRKAIEAPVQSVLETSDRIYVGCWGRGLYCYDKQMNPLPVPASLKKYQDNLSVWDMQQHSPTGNIWLVQQGGDITVLNPKTGSSALYRPAVFNNRTIRQVTEDKEGNLWLGTQGGAIIKWDYRQSGGDPATGYSLVATTGLIHKLATDTKGFVWVATLGWGLLKINPATNKIVHTFTEKGKSGEQLIANMVNDVFAYNDSTVIALAGGINMINTRTGKVRQIGQEDGLPSAAAVTGERDQHGILWIGMVNGLCRVNLQRNIFTLYDRRDGIDYDNFPVAAAYRLSDGRMLFTTDHNFLLFRPAQFLKQKPPPPPCITGINVGDQALLIDSVRKKGKLSLPHNRNSLAISFSAFAYLKQEKLHYYYQLEGLNKSWVHTTAAQPVVYNYLPPGKYVFKVKSENIDGQMSAETLSLPIVISPPFWRSWWFYFVLIVLVVTGLFLIDQARLQRLRAVQQTRTEIAGSLHREVNTALSNINILSEMARMKTDEDADRAKEFIHQISEKSHNMIIMMDDMLWSIDPLNDTLEETMKRLQEFIAALQSRHEAFIQLIVGKKVTALKLNMKLRHELFITMKEVIRLIVEQAGGRDTLINIDLVKSKLLVKMRDEGACLNGNAPAVAGKVRELEKRMASINGELDLQVRGCGFSAVIMVPV